MTELAPNDFYKDENGEYIRIVAVNSTIVTVENRKSRIQRTLSIDEVNGKIKSRHWTGQGSFGAAETNWPGAN